MSHTKKYCSAQEVETKNGLRGFFADRALVFFAKPYQRAIRILKRGTMLLVILAGVACLAAGQERFPWQRKQKADDLSELRPIAQSDPVKDFQAAKARSDIHFIGIRGFTILVPGVGDGYQAYGIEARVVKGTGDFVTSEEQLSLTKKVRIYAEKYNTLVLEFLSQKRQDSKKSK